MERHEKLAYAAIITAENAAKFVEQWGGDFPKHVAVAEQTLAAIPNRIGTVRFLYSDDAGGLSDLSVTWNRPQTELLFTWFSIPEGVEITRAVVRLARTQRGNIAVMDEWTTAARVVKEWTQPGWFRCHICKQRHERKRDSPIVVASIYCDDCWRQHGRKLGKTNNSL